MTFRGLVEYLEERIKAHRLVNQYGFGNLSDIETPDETSPEYPYVFLRPVDMQIAAHSNQFSFELILMDYTFETEYSYIDGASRMLQILADIVEDIRSNKNRDIDIELSVTATPFKERFKDSVVGVTATLNIITAEPLDGCSDVISTQDLLVHVTNAGDYTIGPDDGDTDVLTYETEIVDDGNWTTNKYVVTQDARLKFVLNQDVVFNTLEPGETYPTEFVIREITSFEVFQPTVSNWPTTIVAGETYNLQMEWLLDLQYQGGTQWEFLFLQDQPGEEGTMIQKADGSLKIYELLD